MIWSAVLVHLKGAAVKTDVEQNIGDALRELQEQVREDRKMLQEASGMTPGQRAKRITEMKAIIGRADDLEAELAAVPDA